MNQDASSGAAYSIDSFYSDSNSNALPQFSSIYVDSVSDSSISIGVLYNTSSIGSLLVFSNLVHQNMINYMSSSTDEYSFNVEY
jgi:hypothetical protein